MAVILEKLGCAVTRDGDDLVVTPPSWRFDLAIEEDFVEEIARLHGYDSIPARAPRARLAMLPQTESARPVSRVRQILAGISQHYEPETLVGRNIAIVANLKPAKMMGLESQGMVLAASPGDGAVLLAFDGDVAPGTKIK
jgi:hypothetical protein